MRKHTILMSAGMILFIGCTSPTQRIASHSLKRGMQQDADIVYDLSQLAKQQAVDKGVVKAKTGLDTHDDAMVRAAVEETANTFNKIGWLQIQHERAVALSRIAQMYIDSQQGIVDILIKEADEAKKRSDTKNSN